jgi:thiol:disulfide interchange protein
MKKLILIFIALIGSFSIFAQGDKQVKIASYFTETKPGEGEIVVNVRINKGYHVFSFNPGGDGSSIPPELKFTLPPGVTAIGKPKEQGKLIKHEEKSLDIVLNYFENEVKYIQPVKYSKLQKGKVKYSFQVCNQEMCFPPTDLEVPFDMSINATGAKNGVAANVPVTSKAKDSSATKTNTANADTITSASSQVPPATDVTTNADTGFAADFPEQVKTNASEIVYGEYGKIVGDCGEAQDEKLSPWLAFFYGLLGGLAALFFPCTLPMIPMTISFFLKGNETKQKGIRNGVLYGFFIFLVYFLLSLPFLFLNLGGDALNGFATNPWVNIVFFIVFIVFALSLFGFYDISLPSGVVNKVDAKSNAKNVGGIFFMALTLAIVSFSCTGPILGLVLGNVDSPGLITPAMSGFGIGLGVPFALFAIFPNLLKALPKSGGWLTTLKVVFGFIEVAFALKFLSNADLVQHWGLLKRETFIIIWVVILVLLALYLFGKFTIKKGYENLPVGTPSKVFGVLALLSALYVGSDLVGLKPSLIGFPPPEFYSYSYKEEKLKNGTEAKTHTVKGLTVYTNLEDAKAEAIKQNKPIMIDFTGWACVNCRRMEEDVWPIAKVNEILKDKYIVASLYVDDKRELPVAEQFEAVSLKKKAVTIGNKWSDMQITSFKNAGQPYYVLIDPKNNRILNTPKPYTPDAGKYAKFLECGLSNYKSLNK